MIREGHEVGSHTYTHPNLATVGKTQTLFELNATQRLFQAFTGRTLKLFRAPFFGDAEPTHRRRNRARAGGAEPRLYLGRPARRQRGLAAAGRAGDRQQRHLDAIAERRHRLQRSRPKRSAAATSCCSTIPAATAARPSRRCRSSSIRCAPTAIASCPCRSSPACRRSQAMPPLSPGGPSRGADRPWPCSSCSAFIDHGARLPVRRRDHARHRARARPHRPRAALGLEGAAARARPAIDPDTFVTVLIPAFNEERVIERSVARCSPARCRGSR